MRISKPILILFPLIKIVIGQGFWTQLEENPETNQGWQESNVVNSGTSTPSYDPNTSTPGSTIASESATQPSERRVIDMQQGQPSEQTGIKSMSVNTMAANATVPVQYKPVGKLLPDSPIVIHADIKYEQNPLLKLSPDPSFSESLNREVSRRLTETLTTGKTHGIPISMGQDHISGDTKQDYTVDSNINLVMEPLVMEPVAEYKSSSSTPGDQLKEHKAQDTAKTPKPQTAGKKEDNNRKDALIKKHSDPLSSKNKSDGNKAGPKLNFSNRNQEQLSSNVAMETVDATNTNVAQTTKDVDKSSTATETAQTTKDVDKSNSETGLTGVAVSFDLEQPRLNEENKGIKKMGQFVNTAVDGTNGNTEQNSQIDSNVETGTAHTVVKLASIIASESTGETKQLTNVDGTNTDSSLGQSDGELASQSSFNAKHLVSKKTPESKDKTEQLPYIVTTRTDNSLGQTDYRLTSESSSNTKQSASKTASESTDETKQTADTTMSDSILGQTDGTLASKSSSNTEKSARQMPSEYTTGAKQSSDVDNTTPDSTLGQTDGKLTSQSSSNTEQLSSKMTSELTGETTQSPDIDTTMSGSTLGQTDGKSISQSSSYAEHAASQTASEYTAEATQSTTIDKTMTDSTPGKTDGKLVSQSSSNTEQSASKTASEFTDETKQSAHIDKTIPDSSLGQTDEQLTGQSSFNTKQTVSKTASESTGESKQSTNIDTTKPENTLEQPDGKLASQSSSNTEQLASKTASEFTEETKQSANIDNSMPDITLGQTDEKHTSQSSFNTEQMASTTASESTGESKQSTNIDTTIPDNTLEQTAGKLASQSGSNTEQSASKTASESTTGAKQFTDTTMPDSTLGLTDGKLSSQSSSDKEQSASKVTAEFTVVEKQSTNVDSTLEQTDGQLSSRSSSYTDHPASKSASEFTTEAKQSTSTDTTMPDSSTRKTDDKLVSQSSSNKEQSAGKMASEFRSDKEQSTNMDTTMADSTKGQPDGILASQTSSTAEQLASKTSPESTSKTKQSNHIDGKKTDSFLRQPDGTLASQSSLNADQSVSITVPESTVETIQATSTDGRQSTAYTARTADQSARFGSNKEKGSDVSITYSSMPSEGTAKADQSASQQSADPASTADQTVDVGGTKENKGNLRQADSSLPTDSTVTVDQSSDKYATDSTTTVDKQAGIDSTTTDSNLQTEGNMPAETTSYSDQSAFQHAAEPTSTADQTAGIGSTKEKESILKLTDSSVSADTTSKANQSLSEHTAGSASTADQSPGFVDTKEAVSNFKQTDSSIRAASTPNIDQLVGQDTVGSEGIIDKNVEQSISSVISAAASITNKQTETALSASTAVSDAAQTDLVKEPFSHKQPKPDTGPQTSPMDIGIPVPFDMIQELPASDGQFDTSNSMDVRDSRSGSHTQSDVEQAATDAAKGSAQGQLGTKTKTTADLNEKTTQHSEKKDSKTQTDSSMIPDRKTDIILQDRTNAKSPEDRKAKDSLRDKPLVEGTPYLSNREIGKTTTSTKGAHKDSIQDLGLDNEVITYEKSPGAGGLIIDLPQFSEHFNEPDLPDTTNKISKDINSRKEEIESLHVGLFDHLTELRTLDPPNQDAKDQASTEPKSERPSDKNAAYATAVDEHFTNTGKAQSLEDSKALVTETVTEKQTVKSQKEQAATESISATAHETMVPPEIIIATTDNIQSTTVQEPTKDAVTKEQAMVPSEAKTTITDTIQSTTVTESSGKPMHKEQEQTAAKEPLQVQVQVAKEQAHTSAKEQIQAAKEQAHTAAKEQIPAAKEQAHKAEKEQVQAAKEQAHRAAKQAQVQAAKEQADVAAKEQAQVQAAKLQADIAAKEQAQIQAAKEQADIAAKEQAQVQAAKEQADIAAKEQAQVQAAKEQADIAAKEQAQIQAAKEQADRAAKEQAQIQAAKEQAQIQAAKEQAHRAAKEQAQVQAAKEQADITAKEQAQIQAAKEQADRAAKEQAQIQAAKEQADIAAKEQAQIQAAKEQADRAEKEQAQVQAAKEQAQVQAAKEQADRAAKEQAQVQAAKEQAQIQAAKEQAQIQAAKEQADRAAKEQAQVQAAKEQAQVQAAKEQAQIQAAKEQAQIQAAKEQADRAAKEQAQVQAAKEQAQVQAAKEQADRAAKEQAQVQAAKEQAQVQVAKEQAHKSAKEQETQVSKQGRQTRPMHKPAIPQQTKPDLPMKTQKSQYQISLDWKQSDKTEKKSKPYDRYKLGTEKTKEEIPLKKEKPGSQFNLYNLKDTGISNQGIQKEFMYETVKPKQQTQNDLTMKARQNIFRSSSGRKQPDKKENKSKPYDSGKPMLSEQSIDMVSKTTQTNNNLGQSTNTLSPLQQKENKVETTQQGPAMFEPEEPLSLEALCTHSQFVDGIGYVEYPGQCHKLVQCYQYRGRVLAVPRECPGGYFWHQDHVLCRPPIDVPCWDDPCLDISVDTYNRSGGCRSYYGCFSGISEPLCCEEGQRYNGFACVPDPKCHDPCMTPYDLENMIRMRSCKSLPDEFNPYGYYASEYGGMRIRACPAGTVFKGRECGCRNFRRKGGLRSRRRRTQCSPSFYMNFNNGFQELSGSNMASRQHNVVIQDGAAIFNGRSRITIWGFMNKGLGKKFAIRLRFKPHEKGTEVGSLIANCGRTAPSSVSIEMDNHQLKLSAHTENYKSPTVIKEYIDPYAFNDVLYVYDGRNFIVNSKDGFSHRKPLGGNIRTRPNAMVIGGCPNQPGFKGLIDSVEIYSECIPRDIFTKKTSGPW